MGDVEVGHVELAAQLEHQVHHARAHGDVEHAHRFVGDDELGFKHEGAGDRDALQLAAGEIGGKALGEARRRLELDLFEHALGTRTALARIADAVDQQRLDDGVENAMARIERLVGILEDHLHAAAMRLERGTAQINDIPAVEVEAAGARPLLQRDQLACRGLAGAAFADQREHLALREREIDAVDRAQLRAAREETAAEVVELGEGTGFEKTLRLTTPRGCVALPLLELRRGDNEFARSGHDGACRKVAQRLVRIADPHARRRLASAQRLGIRAARGEAATDMIAARHEGLAGQSSERSPGTGHARQGAEQCSRIGMARVGEDPRRRGQLDDLAGIHDGDLRAALRDGAHVVRDQDQRQVHAPAQRVELAEDLILDQHVERGGRLVGDHQGRLVQQAERDHRALAHAARELVRESLQPLARNADEIEDLGDTRLCRCGTRPRPMQPIGVEQLALDRHDRIERIHRALEDDRGARPTQALQHFNAVAHHAPPIAQDRFAVERDVA